MIPITEFALERSDESNGSVQEHSKLLRHGIDTGTRLEGVELLYQIECDIGFLFIVDFDCPFEESIHFIYVNRDLKVVSSRIFGAPYTSCWISSLTFLQNGTIQFVLNDHSVWNLKIRPWGIPVVFPQLSFRRLQVR